MSRCLSGLRECESCFRPLNAGSLLTNEYRMIVLAIYSLVIAHPGPIFDRRGADFHESDVNVTSNDFAEKVELGMSTRH